MINYRITGHEAIRIANRESISIYCYANPINDGAKVTPNIAVQIASEDPSFIYITVTPSGMWRDRTGNYCDSEGRNAHDYFSNGDYLGPDDDGIEPGFNQAEENDAQ